MPRYRLEIEYDGTLYAGWQRQDGHRSIQQAIEEAIHAFTGETVSIRGAGRTDAGVHATGQVAHVDLEKDWQPDKVRDAINAHLRLADDRVAVREVWSVLPEFDARFLAIARHYRYRIINRRAPLTLERDRAWWVPRALDVDAMHEAAQRLVGRHDFTTFRSTQCQANSPIRTLERLEVVRVPAEIIEVRALARSFLHNQVRSMVGTLRHVGDGSWTADDVSGALEAKDRRACGTVAPPEGLYLEQVDYPAI